MRVLGSAGQHPQMIESGKINEVLRQAITRTSFDGTPAQKQSQQQTISRMSLEYLAQEINLIIIARQIDTLKDYQAVARTGRRVRLNALQRRAVWSVSATFQQLLSQRHELTWSQLRARAEQLIGQSSLAGSYDAIIIDEAQDLEPSALRLLVQLCKSSHRLFLTADANQAIYGSGFSWADVHADLRFQGCTAPPLRRDVPLPQT